MDVKPASFIRSINIDISPHRQPARITKKEYFKKSLLFKPYLLILSWYGNVSMQKNTAYLCAICYIAMQKGSTAADSRAGEFRQAEKFTNFPVRPPEIIGMLFPC